MLETDSNTDLRPLPEKIVRPVADYRIAVPARASTMSSEAGAGFYSDYFGPAPYVFGSPPDQVYLVLAFQTPVLLSNGRIYHAAVVRAGTKDSP
jgi:hypothetical protein